MDRIGQPSSKLKQHKFAYPIGKWGGGVRFPKKGAKCTHSFVGIWCAKRAAAAASSNQMIANCFPATPEPNLPKWFFRAADRIGTRQVVGFGV